MRHGSALRNLEQWRYNQIILEKGIALNEGVSPFGL